MIVTILGKRRHGKTTLARRLVRERLYRNCLIVDLFNQFPEYPLKSLEAVVARFRAGEMFFRPARLAIYEPEDFSLLCALVLAVRQCTLVVDEVDFFTSPTRSSRSFYRAIHYSSHFEIDLITTSRRPANIPRDLTSQTDLFYLFRMSEPRDVLYVKETLGTRASEGVRTLPPFRYLLCDEVHEGGMPGEVRPPAIREPA